ncbi:MAG TPA: hypothetical protein VM370_07550 [Candidatus Thermoplasmatota archaeon]|nr:hypothetical protein [Candidatus Thermoplasmatota archaeon]
MLRWLALLILLAPVAAAQQAETLASWEEPHKGTDKVWDLIVTQEEAGAQRALIYLNPPSIRFSFVIYDVNGTEIFVKNGTLGIQTLPALKPGPYKFFIRGSGEIQITEKAFERVLKENNVSARLRGTDAYVLAPSQFYDVGFTGDVRVDWLAVSGPHEELTPPFTKAAAIGDAYIFTIRGEEATPYTVTLTPTAAPTKAESSGAGLAALLVAGLAAAVLTRRT